VINLFCVVVLMSFFNILLVNYSSEIGQMKSNTFTCTSPVNMAVIKYWGKRDEKLILPLNDSLSLTLNQKNLFSKTTVELDENFEKDELWLNGE
jgi:mevalonate pyrophosphate decarboxylase